MQIKIEIDVKPEELRRFLGLPDVAGLQDDLVEFIRGKMNSASETLDPAAVIQGGVHLFKRSPAWKILIGSGAFNSMQEAEAAEAAAAAMQADSGEGGKPSGKKSGTKARRKAARNPTVTDDAES